MELTTFQITQLVVEFVFGVFMSLVIPWGIKVTEKLGETCTALAKVASDIEHLTERNNVVIQLQQRVHELELKEARREGRQGQ